jgi:hypothetical protein
VFDECSTSATLLDECEMSNEMLGYRGALPETTSSFNMLSELSVRIELLFEMLDLLFASEESVSSLLGLLLPSSIARNLFCQDAFSSRSLAIWSLTPLFNLANVQKVMGFMELDYLADALKEYANNPQAVLDFIEDIMRAEGN